MFIGVLFGVFVAVAGLTLSSAVAPEPTAASARAAAPRRTAQRRAEAAQVRRPAERALPAPVERALPVPAQAVRPVSSDIYSLHARRRFAAFLRMRLLEMRKAGLARAAAVVEHRLPADTLLGH